MVWLYRSPIPVGRREVFSCSNYFYLPSRRIKEGGWRVINLCIAYVWDIILFYFSDLVDFSYIDQRLSVLKCTFQIADGTTKDGSGITFYRSKYKFLHLVFSIKKEN